MPSATGVSGTLLDQAPDGVLLVSPTDHTILDVNATFCQLTGWSRDDLLGRAIETIVDPEDLRTRPLAPDQARAGVAVSERRLLTPDGGRLWCQTTTRLTEQSYLVFVRDIGDLIRDRHQLDKLTQVAQLRTDLTAALLDPDAPLPTVLDRAASGLVASLADLCIVALVDQSRELLIPIAFHHRDTVADDALAATLTTRPMELGTGTAGKVAVDGVPRRFADLSLEDIRATFPPQYRSYIDRFPINSMLIVPLRGHQGVMGTLGLARQAPFDDRDERLVVDVADLVALAIEDARNDAQVRRTNFLLRTVTNTLPAMVSYWNADLRNEYANDAYEQWFGVPGDQMRHRHAREVLGDEAFERYGPFIEGVLAGHRQDYDRPLVDAAGRVRHVQVTYVPDIRPGGHVAGFVALATDITAWTEAAAEFEYQALHDPLTGLANRRALMVRIDQALKNLGDDGGVVALVFVDLNDFKQVNDREGHDVGDRVLMATAEHLRRVIRPGDTAARLGGDEFVVLCHTADRARIDEVCADVRAPVVVALPGEPDRDFTVTASAGVAVAEDPDGTSPEQLLADADAAMFRSKRGSA